MDLQQRIIAARSRGGVPIEALDVRYSSLGEMLDHWAETTPEAPYLIYADDAGGRREYSYRAFRERVRQVAATLHAHGVRRGDRVATMAHNHPETVGQYFAAWWIGATVVPLNMGEDDARLRYILENSAAVVAFVRSEYLDRAREITAGVESLRELLVCGDDFEGLRRIDGTPFELRPNGTGFERYVSSETHRPVVEARSDRCLIVYTSGTTGHPKGVVLAQENLLADAEGICGWHGIDAETRMMCVLPIHHVNGTVVTLVAPMYAGGSVVLTRKFHTGAFFPLIEHERVAIVSVVPTLLAYLVQADVDIAGRDLGSLRHVICGAGPLTCELAGRFEDRYHIPIVHGYGLSETTCYSCFLPVGLEEAERRTWLTAHGFPSIGVPIPQNEMAIHDAEGRPLGAGERGEIVIRGHNVMLEYYNNPPANEAAFTHAWFRSGDEGFWLPGADDRAYYFITGRLKELIIRGGVNISPLEVDEIINAHPKVEAGIAVGFESNWYGEEIGAYVRPADSTLTEEELLEYLSEHLPYFKCPKVVIFGDEIPVTSTGKYQRNRVRELFEPWRDRQFTRRGGGKM